jgi:hypothetical protein
MPLHPVLAEKLSVSRLQLKRWQERPPMLLYVFLMDQEFTEVLLYQKALGRRPSPRLLRRLVTPVAQELTEAEGPDDRRHPAAAEGRVDLPRQHPR